VTADRSATVVWVSPSATSYACLCEPCLESARLDGELFGDALRVASIRGAIAAEATSAVARCAAGHELLVRRVERPPGLLHPDHRQLQIRTTA
jgi:hypothetical protein